MPGLFSSLLIHPPLTFFHTPHGPITLSQVIGNSLLPPYWALGFHQSRFGLENVSMVERTVQGYIDRNIPLEVCTRRMYCNGHAARWLHPSVPLS
jgi:hypothetical protein